MQQLLESEGIVVVDHQIVDFEKTLLDSDVMEQCAQHAVASLIYKTSVIESD
jgi:uncharacterized protein YjaZ